MRYIQPLSISELLDQLEDLATYGVAKVDTDIQAWFEAVGVAAPAKDGKWMSASNNWLEACLPAKNEHDLLRNTAIRDPLYRAHIDVILCSVLHAVGKAERWTRFEELLAGKFRPFSLRFVQLLEWLAANTSTSIRDLQEFHWIDAEEQLGREKSDSFHNWDEELWGVSGRQPSTLFPLLEELYLPLCDKPLYLDRITMDLTAASSNLLADLIHATKQGDGLTLAEKHMPSLNELLDIGLPIRVDRNANGSDQNRAGLIGPVIFKSDAPVSSNDFAGPPLPWGIPPHAQKGSCIISTPENSEKNDLLTRFADKQDGFAFIGIDYNLTVWPTEDENHAKIIKKLPQSTPVPSLEVINKIGLPRSKSPDADIALAHLGNHLYFGLLLQLLILESLDRELGEESLILAPPTSGKLEQIETETQIFYKPRATDQKDEGNSNAWSFTIGRFDEVLNRLSSAIYINKVIYPYCMQWGPWSRGLHLYRTAGIITGLHDRWALSPHVLDRLHGGGLMSGIIRKGRDFRDRLHEALMVMWNEKMRNEMDLENMSGNNS